jgi:hypothetical protein
MLLLLLRATLSANETNDFIYDPCKMLSSNSICGEISTDTWNYHEYDMVDGWTCTLHIKNWNGNYFWADGRCSEGTIGCSVFDIDGFSQTSTYALFDCHYQCGFADGIIAAIVIAVLLVVSGIVLLIAIFCYGYYTCVRSCFQDRESHDDVEYHEVTPQYTESICLQDLQGYTRYLQQQGCSISEQSTVGYDSSPQLSAVP